MWAEHHTGVGAAIYSGAFMVSHIANGTDPGFVQIIPAILLACMTHPFIDDANVDEVRTYHGIGEKLPTKITTSFPRAIYWALFIWLAWHQPLMLTVAIPAWLICDWEWLAKWNVGLGIHNKNDKRPWLYMYPQWLKTQWGLIPVVGFIILAVWLVVGIIL